MFEELRVLLREETNIPPLLKGVVLITSRVMEWLVWVFVGVGILLSKEYFPFWFVFILVVFGALVLLFIYTLLQIVKIEARSVTSREQISTSPIIDKALSGIIGSVAFYGVILVVFVIFKAMGIFDQILSGILKSVGY